MPKLIKVWKEEEIDPWNDVLARWLLLLGVVDHQDIYKELEEIAMGEDKELRYALENWEELSMTQEQYLAYEGRLKQINDDVAFKREMELRLEEGIKESISKEKEAIARRLLEAGMAVEFVVESTGLEKDKVIAIKNR